MAKYKFYDGTNWVELLKSTDISSWAKGATKPTYTASEVGAIATTGGTLSGALNFANGTYNNIGDDTKFGDINVAGTVGLKGINGQTCLAFVNKDNSYYTRLVSQVVTANIDITLPKSSGTLALNSTATQSVNGLMSSTDKTKLDGIASGATAVSETTVSGWGFTKNAGTVTSVKVGSTSYSPSRGVISLPAYPDATGLVPYSGAANSVDLGTYNLSASSIYVGPAGSRTEFNSEGFGFGNENYLNFPTISGSDNEETIATQEWVENKGYTKNAGTVTSVSAGTGLVITGTASVNPTVGIASGYKLPTTTEWNGLRQVPTVNSSDKNKFLHTNASTGALEWSSVSGGSASQATTNSLGTIKVLATRGSSFNSSALNYGYGNSNGGDEWNYSLGICYGVELTSNGKAFIRACRNFWIHNIVIESSGYRISFQFISDNDYYPYTSFYGIAYDMYYHAQSLPASGVAGSGRYVYKVAASDSSNLTVYYQNSSGTPNTLTLSSDSGYTITDTVQEIHGAPTYR